LFKGLIFYYTARLFIFGSWSLLHCTYHDQILSKLFFTKYPDLLCVEHWWTYAMQRVTWDDWVFRVYRL